MTNTIIKSIQKIIVKRRLIWTITSFWFLFSNLTKTCSGPIEANQRYLKKILNSNVANHEFGDATNTKSSNVEDWPLSNTSNSNNSSDIFSNIPKAQSKTSSGISGDTQTAPGTHASTSSSEDEGYETDTLNGNTEQESDGTFSNTSNDDKKNELGASENPGSDGSKGSILNNGSDQYKRSPEDIQKHNILKSQRRKTLGGVDDEEANQSEDEQKNSDQDEQKKKLNEALKKADQDEQKKKLDEEKQIVGRILMNEAFDKMKDFIPNLNDNSNFSSSMQRNENEETNDQDWDA